MKQIGQADLGRRKNSTYCRTDNWSIRVFKFMHVTDVISAEITKMVNIRRRILDNNVQTI